MGSNSVTLDLRQLRQGIPALTAALGEVHSESAAICLENQGHAESVTLQIRDAESKQFELIREPVTEAMRRAYFDLQRATELGAVGVALLLRAYAANRTDCSVEVG